MQSKPHNKSVIFFDGYCNLCTGSVQFILKYERSGYHYFSSLQSDYVKKNFPGLYAEGSEPDSLILLENGILHHRSDAALRISRKMKFPFSLIYYLIFLPRFIRDYLYDLTARNRYRIFGKRDSCYIPDPSYSERFLQ